MPPEISFSDGSRYASARLVVRRDWTTLGRSRWRLAWDDGPDSTTFLDAASSVTEPDSRVWYRTMRAAITAGERRYGVPAVRVWY